MGHSRTRELLIQEGLKSFLAYGYDGVGIGPVLSSVGVPKGSFYHFFESKEQFAIAVLNAYIARYEQLRDDLRRGPRPPLDRLRAHFDAHERELNVAFAAGGCLYGVLSQTVAALGPTLRQRLKEAFASWQDSICKALTEAQALRQFDPSIDAREAAAFLIDAYEGALIRGRVEGVAAALARFRRFALEPVLAPTPPSPPSDGTTSPAALRKRSGPPGHGLTRRSAKHPGTRG